MILAGVILTVLFVAAVLLFPRWLAALGVMSAVLYITQSQQVEVVGFHFTAVRIVLLAGLIRTAMRGELRKIKFNPIDSSFVAFTLVVCFVPVIRTSTSEQLVYSLGCAYDIFLSYFVFRALLLDWETVRKFFFGLSILIIPMTLEMIYETATNNNLFVPFGGIGELTIRKGRPRCQGAFRHGINAGIFGATLVPIFLGFVISGYRRFIFILGLVCTVIITYTSNSSGPLMAILMGLIAWMFWPMRRKMRLVRRGLAATLIGLHLAMKVPVWFIFSKMSDYVGGDGWHRSYLIDQTIRHFSGWWLIGTSYTGDWMATTLSEGGADITNAFVSAAVNGGLAALVLYILVFVRCFRTLGLAMKKAAGTNTQTVWMLWGIGASLTAHVMVQFDTTYWDQLGVFWWGFVAAMSSITSETLEENETITIQLESEIQPKIETVTI